ncbi:MAG TPA: hypothetical protein DCY13_19760, partial [Verrucomicrobiales bacterium]|nr:hypothetical protein [Verrucomicrobiales bacterium]
MGVGVEHASFLLMQPLLDGHDAVVPLHEFGKEPFELVPGGEGALLGRLFDDLSGGVLGKPGGDVHAGNTAIAAARRLTDRGTIPAGYEMDHVVCSGLRLMIEGIAGLPRWRCWMTGGMLVPGDDLSTMRARSFLFIVSFARDRYIPGVPPESTSTPMPPSPGHLHFEFTHGPARPSQRREPEAAMRLLFIADFSGRANRGIREPLANRKPRRVDADTFDAVMNGFEAAIRLPLVGAPAAVASISIGSIDDFHPDSLLKKIPSLAELLTIRKDLESSKAASAAEKLQSLLKLAPPKPAETKQASDSDTQDSGAGEESTGETLARLLGKAPTENPHPAARAAEGMDAQAIIKRILSEPGKAAPPPPAGLTGLINAAKMELSDRLRSLLSHPDFQSVEAAWRGLDLLIRRCPDEERIAYHALDATLEELAADLDGLHRLLRDHAWGALIGGFQFGRSTADLSALAGLAAVSQSLGTAILGGG